MPMDQVITHWVNSLAGSNGALDSFMILVSLFGVPLLRLSLRCCNGGSSVNGCLSDMLALPPDCHSS